MESNFEFLKLDYDTADLFLTANNAEKNYAQEDYEAALTKARKLAEALSRMVADQEYIEIDERVTFHQVLQKIKYSIEDTKVVDCFFAIKDLGNDSAHNINPRCATKDNALKALQQLFFILVWYMQTYVDPEIKSYLYQRFLEPQAQALYRATERKFIYVQTVNNDNGQFPAYEGTQKIGEGTVAEDDIEADWTANSDFLRTVAPKRIKQYMTTAGLKFELGWVELAYRKANKTWFHDYDVHNILKRSGIKQSDVLEGNEWYQTDLETAKSAIKAVKEGREYLHSLVELDKEEEITLRPEQLAAVKQTEKAFKKHQRMLWNAKMRFGKTLTALQLIKNQGFQKVLIMTHRPVVKDSWFEDFKKMKMSDVGYEYGSDSQGASLVSLKTTDRPFLYFASIQKLRYKNGQTNLKDFADIDWDLIIIDEAHEGTQTELSDRVMSQLINDKTKILELSGTPFNLLDQFEDEQVYTWDYTMEQHAKTEWKFKHPNETNPYEKLPKVNMFTFDMRHKEKFSDESRSFNFREFFKVNETGELVYRQDVNAFLDNITNYDSENHYPFSTEAYRNELRHTLWLMPGVKEANAFEKLLKQHAIFGQEYKIVNVVKDSKNDDGIASQADIDMVRNAISDDPSQTKTITLTVRKLTTGVNIPEWTAVLFLSNTNSAMNYLQAAFRAQTPFSHEKLGRKENCYIFDFAPDRALSVMAESAQINSGVGKKNTQEQKDAMTRLLNFMPILGASGNEMKPYNVDKLLTQLKKVYAEKAVRSGFEDDSLYNDSLLTLESDEVEKFKDLNAIVGSASRSEVKKIVVNENGLTDEEYEKGERAKKKKRRERTKEEQELIDKISEAKKQRKAMISILRGVSIRIPMMIYGMATDISKDITINDFIKAVDDQSWKEFMPKGFTKGMFKDITKYYDAEVFVEAGRIIRQKAKSFDSLDFIDRAEAIADLFGTFKNPDKETVLTPWRVVNMQLSKGIGGLNFFDDDFTSTTNGATSNLHWVERGTTDDVYKDDTHILEINSKTGLYPLHAAMSLYYKKMNDNQDYHFEADNVYREILENNIYAIAKTPMAKTITERTLAGYRHYKTNVTYIENLTDTLKTDIEKGKKLVEEAFNNVKFDVVIGNPPYQEATEGTSDSPIYNHFMELSYSLADKVCLITPARFLFNAGKTPKAWNTKMLADEHFKVIYYTQKSDQVFPNTDIKGGVVVTYRDSDKKFGAIETFTAYEELTEMCRLVYHREDFESLSAIVFAPESYKLTSKLHADYPFIEDRLSNGHKFDITTNIFDKLPEIFVNTKPNSDYVEIIGRQGGERIIKYINKNYITGPENFKKYKVLLPKANGSGAIGEVLSTPLVGTPLVGHTQTFLSIGSLETEYEANSLLKYIKTPFARTLLGVLKITQDNKKAVWKYVPIQDFSKKSDVPWDKSIEEIHDYLCQKYNYNDSHKKFMVNYVSKMD